jgi:hypothetical protein
MTCQLLKHILPYAFLLPINNGNTMKFSNNPREDETLGAKIAERLGLKVDYLLSGRGCDGYVYQLTNRQVMKTSWSKSDAITSLGILHLQHDNDYHPILPIVHDLRTYHDKKDPNATIYIIIRDDIKDYIPSEKSIIRPNMLPQFDSECENQMNHLEKLAKQLKRLSHREFIQAAHDIHQSYKMSSYQKLAWNIMVTFYEQLGIVLGDFTPSNLGILQNGEITFRDWGVCNRSPEWLSFAIKHIKTINGSLQPNEVSIER